MIYLIACDTHNRYRSVSEQNKSRYTFYSSGDGNRIFFDGLKIEAVQACGFTDITYPFPKIIFPLIVVNKKVTKRFSLQRSLYKTGVLKMGEEQDEWCANQGRQKK